MPVLSRDKHDRLHQALMDRYINLRDMFEPRDLKHDREGAGGRNARWVQPDKMCGTKGKVDEIALAIADFDAILKEIKKLK